ncbi:hypothetical protein ACF0H5_008222 [Mactra antiquata]
MNYFVRNFLMSNSNGEPNVPFYNTEVITWTLEYITNSFSGSGKTLIEKLSKTTDSIQKILLQLSSSLCSCHRLPEKRRILIMYRLFTRLLLKQFHTRLGDTWAFVLRDVIYRVVYIIKDMTKSTVLQNENNSSTDNHYRRNIACTSIDLLREVCQVAMETCSKELMKYLPFLTSNLVSISEINGDVGKLSLGLLKYLILEKAGDLQVAIATLENFPDRPVFKDCRIIHHRIKYSSSPYSLKQMRHYVSLCVNL